MKYFVAVIYAAMLWGGAAAASEMPVGSNPTPSFLIFPSWYEVMEVIKQGKAKGKGEEGDATPAEPRKGVLRPYLGVNETSLNAYLIPGNLLDVSGGLSYYVSNTGQTGSLGVVFAVKDRISNRLVGYNFEPANLTTYISLSINY